MMETCTDEVLSGAFLELAVSGTEHLDIYFPNSDSVSWNLPHNREKMDYWVFPCRWLYKLFSDALRTI